MKKLILFLFAALTLSVSAQTQRELIQAYRNGTLSQEQIDAARNKISQTEAVDAKVDRMRTVTSSSSDNLSEAQPAPDNTLKESASVGVKGTGKKIFGHDLFTNKQLTFEPNLNIATPTNYVLGPGDELIIDIWGDSQMTINEIISPEGKIKISGVGLVSVSGLTIEEATQRLRRQLSVIYEGLRSGTVKMKLSLGSIRSIQVNIAGEVGAAGTYTLPSLATLFHALHTAGGVNELGSLRSIKLYREGKLFSEVDVYDYILNGKTTQDVSLREGDLIVVPTYEKLIEVQGDVKRPMYYELKGEETAADVINFVGGFTNDANRNMLSVTRSQDGGEYHDYSVDSKDYASFVMADGDVVYVAGNIDRYKNRVEVQGAVYREGYYAIDDKVKTVKQLIERAGGLRNDAFMARAILYREKPDWSMEVEAVDLAALMEGTVADIELRANDMLVISSIPDMQETYTVRIFGSVKKPDTYPYADNMTVEDVVVAAGGLLESASTANVTITRRIKDPKSMQVSEQLFEIFTIELSDGLVVGKQKGFELKPFDQIYVRRSPVYVTQGSVAVKGEVAFEGNYPLSHRNMRLSEALKAAGGTTSGAYLEGAYLLRRMTEEEVMQKKTLQKMIDAQVRRSQQKEEEQEPAAIELDSVMLEEVYPVGIRLDKALDEPNSDFDVVLRDGDVICIPEYNGTTRVMGAVLYPNTITYSEGMSVKKYVKAAGGFDLNARKRRVFVIHVNGMVESGLRAKVRPGSIIIVPSKAPSTGIKWEHFHYGLQSTASMMAVIVSTMNIARTL